MKRKPCPFCGRRTPILQAGRSKWVVCSNAACGAEGPVRQTKRGAVTAWNNRPAETGKAAA